MKLTAVALASAFALSSTCAFAQPVRHVRTYPVYRDAAPPVFLHPTAIRMAIQTVPPH
jgi:hypothetical protein